MSKEVGFITKTGLMLALALMIQIGLAPFAQPVVGPLINMILLLSVVLVGPWGALVVGTLTPIVAFSVGIIALLPLIPVIILGNGIYALSFWAVGQKNRMIGLIVAAVLKFLALAGGVRILAMFFVPNLPAAVIAAFSIPQLYTALIGGLVTILIIHYLPKKMMGSQWL